MEHWLRLIYLKGFNLNQKRLLVEQLGSAEAVIRAPDSRLQGILASHHEIQRSRRSSYPSAIDIVIENDLNALDCSDAKFIPFNDSRYPYLLNQIDSAPLGLFYVGDIGLLTTPQLAVVGSRNPSRSGLETAAAFARDVGAIGLTITSGMALGIDSYAHRGALEASSPTIAVTATGIDKVYPARNKALHRQICQHGLVITEYPPGTPPKRAYFPQRNRIISGLSLGTLVVEAGVRSGSLITARLAAEQGREVFAIPGSIMLQAAEVAII